MRRAGILASPSIYEPFGLAALEGALSGAALVLADIPTYRELWDGCALFAPMDDAAAFADALDAAASDARLRQHLAQRARRRALEFSPGAQAERVLGVYDEATRLHSSPLAMAG
jgi:glycosyltransferase involved in cell wall biosynthesis